MPRRPVSIIFEVLFKESQALRAISTLKSEIKDLDKSLEDLDEGTQDYEDTAKRLAQAQRALADSLGTDSPYAKLLDDLEKLESESRQTAEALKQVSEGSDTTALQNKYNSLQGEIQKVRGGLKDVENQTLKTADTAKSLNSFKGVLKRITTAFAGFQVLQQLKKATDVTIEFEAALSNLDAITGATQDLAFYEQEARKIGATTTLSATQAVDAFKFIASAKPDLLAARDGLVEVTDKAVTLAQAAQIDLPTAGKALTGILNQFSEAADQSERVINVLAAGSKFGSAGINDLSDGYTKFAKVLKDANGSIEQGVGLQETLAEFNIKGAEAGTQLRNVILKLRNDNVGLVDGQFDLIAALEEVRDKNLSTAEASKLFGLENLTAGSILLDNVDKINRYTASVTGTNIAQEQASKNTNNLKSDLASIGSTVEELYLVVGSALLPTFRTVVQAFGEFLKLTTRLIEPLSKNIDIIAALVAAYTAYQIAVKGTVLALTAQQAITKTLTVAQGLSTAAAIKDVAIKRAQVVATAALQLATALLTFNLQGAVVAFRALSLAISLNPIGLAVAAFVALGAALVILYQRSETVRDGLDTLFRSVISTGELVVDVFGSIKNAIVNAFTLNPLETFSNLFNDLKQSFSDFVGRSNKIELESNLSKEQRKANDLKNELKDIRGKIDVEGLDALNENIDDLIAKEIEVQAQIKELEGIEQIEALQDLKADIEASVDDAGTLDEFNRRINKLDELEIEILAQIKLLPPNDQLKALRERKEELTAKLTLDDVSDVEKAKIRNQVRNIEATLGVTVDELNTNTLFSKFKAMKDVLNSQGDIELMLQFGSNALDEYAELKKRFESDPIETEVKTSIDLSTRGGINARIAELNKELDGTKLNTSAYSEINDEIERLNALLPNAQKSTGDVTGSLAFFEKALADAKAQAKQLNFENTDGTAVAEKITKAQTDYNKALENYNNFLKLIEGNAQTEIERLKERLKVVGELLETPDLDQTQTITLLLEQDTLNEQIEDFTSRVERLDSLTLTAKLEILQEGLLDEGNTPEQVKAIQEGIDRLNELFKQSEAENFSKGVQSIGTALTEVNAQIEGTTNQVELDILIPQRDKLIEDLFFVREFYEQFGDNPLSLEIQVNDIESQITDITNSLPDLQGLELQVETDKLKLLEERLEKVNAFTKTLQSGRIELLEVGVTERLEKVTRELETVKEEGTDIVLATSLALEQRSLQGVKDSINDLKTLTDGLPVNFVINELEGQVSDLTDKLADEDLDVTTRIELEADLTDANSKLQKLREGVKQIEKEGININARITLTDTLKAELSNLDDSLRIETTFEEIDANTALTQVNSLFDAELISEQERANRIKEIRTKLQNDLYDLQRLNLTNKLESIKEELGEDAQYSKEYQKIQKQLSDLDLKQNNERIEGKIKETEEKKKLDEQRVQAFKEGLAEIRQALTNAAKEVIDLKLEENSKLQDLQEQRIDDALDAQSGASSRQVEEERKRLAELEKEREKFVNAQRILALAEVALNIGIAVSKAAAEGGAILSPAFIAAVLGAVAAGIGAIPSVLGGLQAFKDGVIGFVGKGTGTSDENVVRISNGESVIKADATAKNPVTLEKINAGDVNAKDLEDVVMGRAKVVRVDDLTKQARQKVNAFTNDTVTTVIAPTELIRQGSESMNVSSTIKDSYVSEVFLPNFRNNVLTGSPLFEQDKDVTLNNTAVTYYQSSNDKTLKSQNVNTSNNSNTQNSNQQLEKNVNTLTKNSTEVNNRKDLSQNVTTLNEGINYGAQEQTSLTQFNNTLPTSIPFSENINSINVIDLKGVEDNTDKTVKELIKLRLELEKTNTQAYTPPTTKKVGKRIGLGNKLQQKLNK